MGMKIDRSIPKKLETLRTEKPAEARPAQQNVPTQSNGTNPIRAQLLRDSFQGGTSAEQTQATRANVAGANGTSNVTPAELTPAELESAQEAIANAHDGRDARAVAEWLKNNPDPAKQAAFMDLMFEYGPVAGEILNNAQNLPAADRQRLARSLDTAYRSGAVTDEELSSAVAEAHSGALPGQTHEGLADIVARTGNPDLIETYAKRELEILQASGSEDLQRSAAVATALAGLPPARLQEFLENNAAAVGDMLKHIDSDFDSERSPALGKLLNAAGRINPPTAESIKLFTDSIDKIGENTATREAAARFFNRHGDEVLASMQDASGSLGLDGQKKMSEFFTRTLFSPPSFEGQEAFRRNVMNRLDSMNDTLAQHANASPPPADAKRQARLMGSLVGALEGGFQVAVDELNKRNDAVEGMVGLLFSAKELLPDLPIPGAGKLKDLTIDQLQNWVTSSLQEEAQSPADAIPFHRAFGELIANPDLRTDYDAARGDAFLNRERGLS